MIRKSRRSRKGKTRLRERRKGCGKDKQQNLDPPPYTTTKKPRQPANTVQSRAGRKIGQRKRRKRIQRKGALLHPAKALPVRRVLLPPRRKALHGRILHLRDGGLGHE